MRIFFQWRLFFVLTFTLLIATNMLAQQNKIDSLKNLISNTKKDTSKIDLYEKLGVAKNILKGSLFNPNTVSN